MADIKWSAFPLAGTLAAGDTLVGLRAGANVRLSLTFPWSPTLGGTGVANLASSTLTLGGALTTTGAFASTFTMTGATNVTFPTSGTLTALGNTSTGSGAVVLATSPALTTPNIGAATASQLNMTGTGYVVGSTALQDSTANFILKLNTVPSAVNFFAITGNSAGLPPVLSVAGTDTNVSMSLNSKGTGGVIIQGTGTNDNASTGRVGQYIESTILAASSLSLTTTTRLNITSLSLTAGDWDVWGAVGYQSPTGTTNVSYTISWISTTLTGLLDDALMIENNYTSAGIVFSNTLNNTTPIPVTRVSIASTTTVYLAAFSAFTISTLNACGFIRARRAR